MGLVGDLDRFNLVHKIGSPPSTMGEKYDDYGMHLTPLGYQLTQIVRESSSAPEPPSD